MSSEKPFLSIDEQVELLASRGVEVDDQTGGILLREGYVGKDCVKFSAM